MPRKGGRRVRHAAARRATRVLGCVLTCDTTRGRAEEAPHACGRLGDRVRGPGAAQLRVQARPDRQARAGAGGRHPPPAAAQHGRQAARAQEREAQGLPARGRAHGRHPPRLRLPDRQAPHHAPRLRAARTHPLLPRPALQHCARAARRAAPPHQAGGPVPRRPARRPQQLRRHQAPPQGAPYRPRTLLCAPPAHARVGGAVRASQLASVAFQNMFPPLNVATVSISDCKRVVLLNYQSVRHARARARPQPLTCARPHRRTTPSSYATMRSWSRQWA